MIVKINSKLNEKGLFSIKKYTKNEIVFVLSGIEYDNPTRETIYVGNNKHVYDEFGQFMNHSFDPNTYIQNYNVVAIKNINENDDPRSITIIMKLIWRLHYC
jgi:hypothetical protein